jgi:hypothetical protein
MARIVQSIAQATPRSKIEALVDLCSFGHQQTSRKHRTYFSPQELKQKPDFHRVMSNKPPGKFSLVSARFSPCPHAS